MISQINNDKIGNDQKDNSSPEQTGSKAQLEYLDQKETKSWSIKSWSIVWSSKELAIEEMIQKAKALESTFKLSSERDRQRRSSAIAEQENSQKDTKTTKDVLAAVSRDSLGEVIVESATVIQPISMEIEHSGHDAAIAKLLFGRPVSHDQKFALIYVTKIVTRISDQSKVDSLENSNIEKDLQLVSSLEAESDIEIVPLFFGRVIKSHYEKVNHYAVTLIANNQGYDEEIESIREKHALDFRLTSKKGKTGGKTVFVDQYLHCNRLTHQISKRKDQSLATVSEESVKENNQDNKKYIRRFFPNYTQCGQKHAGISRLQWNIKTIWEKLIINSKDIEIGHLGESFKKKIKAKKQYKNIFFEEVENRRARCFWCYRFPKQEVCEFIVDTNRDSFYHLQNINLDFFIPLEQFIEPGEVYTFDKSYKQGDKVRKNGKYFVCIKDLPEKNNPVDTNINPNLERDIHNKDRENIIRNTEIDRYGLENTEYWAPCIISKQKISDLDSAFCSDYGEAFTKSIFDAIECVLDYFNTSLYTQVRIPLAEILDLHVGDSVKISDERLMENQREGYIHKLKIVCENGKQYGIVEFLYGIPSQEMQVKEIQSQELIQEGPGESSKNNRDTVAGEESIRVKFSDKLDTSSDYCDADYCDSEYLLSDNSQYKRFIFNSLLADSKNLAFFDEFIKFYNWEPKIEVSNISDNIGANTNLNDDDQIAGLITENTQVSESGNKRYYIRNPRYDLLQQTRKYKILAQYY